MEVPVIPAPRPAPSSERPLRIIAGIASLLAVVVIVGFVLSRPATQTPRAGNSAPPVPPPPEQQLVADFLERDDWAPRTLDGFIAAWQGMDHRTPTQLSAEPWFNRLVDKLDRQLTQTAALADLGDARARDTLVQLNRMVHILTPRNSPTESPQEQLP
jgi:hypothetical protein